MSGQSNPQEYVIITDSRQASSLPYGYEIAMRGGTKITVLEDANGNPVESSSSTNTTDPIPHIIDHDILPRILDDGTVLADLELLIESPSLNIELRLSQGEAL